MQSCTMTMESIESSVTTPNWNLGGDVGAVINNALSNRETLKVHPGDYTYSTPITVGGISIIGQGLDAVTFASRAAVKFYDGPDGFYSPIFKNFTISEDGGGGTDGICLGKNNQKFDIRNIEVIGLTRDAFQMKGAYNGMFAGIRAQSDVRRYGLLYLGSSDGIVASDTGVIAPQLQAETAGVKVGDDGSVNAVGLSIFGGEVGGSGGSEGKGVDIDTMGINFRMFGTNVENCTTGVHIGNTSNETHLPANPALYGVSFTTVYVGIDVDSGTNVVLKEPRLGGQCRLTTSNSTHTLTGRFISRTLPGPPQERWTTTAT